MVASMTGRVRDRWIDRGGMNDGKKWGNVWREEVWDTQKATNTAIFRIRGLGSSGPAKDQAQRRKSCQADIQL